jgi:carbonic anhydrase/acetyltransferase-like protein (isoleucine patch superfamily)
VCHIRIGARTNIQDLTVIHVNHDTHPTILENEITVGHRAILHGCHIRERSLIGMGAVVMDDAEVGPESIVAAGSLVSPGTRVPPRSLVRGIPARVVRSLSREELAGIRDSVADYVKLKNIYLKGPSSIELAR